MSDHLGWQRYFQVEKDWRGIALVSLFLVVIAGALTVRPWLLSQGAESAVAGSSTTEQAAGGAVWALSEAVFAGILLAAILLWRKLPEWVQDIITDDLTIAIYMLVGASAFAAGKFQITAAAAIVAVTVLKTADEVDVWWVVNDIAALGFAVVLGALLGIALGPWMLAVGLIGLSVYDYVFADRKSWMFTLGSAFIRWKLPVLFLLPTTIRFDWEKFGDALDGEIDEEDAPEIGFGIGMADLAIPAALVVAIAGEATMSLSGGIPVVAVVAGILVACFRVSWKMSNEGGGAGLPPLTSGALGGWVIGSMVVMLV